MNWNETTIAEVTKDQPQLKQAETLAAFKRNWEYMFVYCEVGYARARGSMHYFTFVRPVSLYSFRNIMPWSHALVEMGL